MPVVFCIQKEEAWKEKIGSMLENGEIDAVTFTSASTVKGFVKAMEGLSFSRIQAVCIGEQTAQEARKYGMQTEVAAVASMDGMEELILQKYGGR